MASHIPLPAAIEASYLVLMGEMAAAKARGDDAAFGSLLLKAWELIPEPKLDCDRAQSTAAVIVEHYRDSGRLREAQEWLPTLRAAYGGGENGYAEFIVATVFMDAGRFDEAFALFDKQYAEYKRRPFQGAHPRYLQFYLARRNGSA